ncbi:hypothetical protein TNCV_1669041 [Trichonephila clavipes]|nr:hypothetical protein TNCV_1669041 [Trichonephila clavipes]
MLPLKVAAPGRGLLTLTGIEPRQTSTPLCRRGSRVVKISDRAGLVMSSSTVPLKTPYEGERCVLNLSRAQTSFVWCGVVIRRGGSSSGVFHVI